MRYAIRGDRLAAAALSLLFVAPGCGDGSDCTSENNCRVGASGAPQCMPGYAWQDPDDPDNLTCVPLVVDTMPPETEIVLAPPPLTNAREATIRCRGTDDVGVTGMECSLDQEAFAPCEPETTVIWLSEGQHTFECRAYDSIGQADPTPAAVTWTVDATPLDTEILDGPEAITNQPTASFEFAATGGADLARFECSLDDAPYEICASPLEVGPLEDGDHQLVVVAVDLAGNVDATPAEYEWTSQTVGLATAIDDGPPEFSRWTWADFRLRAVGNGTLEAFYCRLDSGSFESCDARVSFTDLADGAHTFEAYAVDTAGNVESPPASHSWVVDTERPESSWVGTRPPDSDDTIELSFASDEPGTFVCELDMEPTFECSSPLVLTDLGVGKHFIRVKAVDRAGNVEHFGSTHAWVAHCQSLVATDQAASAVEWTAEGIIAGDSNGTLVRWNPATGETELSLTAHSISIDDLDVAGGLVATSSGPTVGVWDLATFDAVASIPDHPSTVNAVSLDGARLATGCYDGVVRVWDIDLGTELSRFEFSGYAQPRVAWRPGGTDELLVTDGNFLMLWNAVTDEIVWSLHQSDRINSIDWTPDGTIATSGADDGTVWLSAAADGARVGELDVGWDVSVVLWFSDASHLLVADEAGVVTTWDASTWALDWTITLAGMVADVALSPDDSELVGAWNAYRCALDAE